MSSRVLLVTNIFPPSIGGPASFIDRLAHALARSGVRVTVVCSSDAPICAEDDKRPFRVVRTTLIPRERYEVLIRARLFREMALHDCILVNGLEQYVCPAARLLRKRYVLKVVGDTVWETARNRGETLLDFDTFQADAAEQSRFKRDVNRRNAWIRQARHVLVPSEYLRKQVTSWSGDAVATTVIPNGVDRAATSAAPRRNGSELRVLFVGRLTNWKGVDTVLLAAAKVPNVHLDIVGDGPCLPSLVALSSQLGLSERVRFRRRLSPETTRQAMHEAHALVLTSLYEGLSHTLLEAMSAGIPCIASNRGGNPEVVTDGTDGILIPPENVEALAGAFDRLAVCEDDRCRLGEAASRRASAFDFASTVERTQTVLLSA